jgi:hypothetical protein
MNRSLLPLLAVLSTLSVGCIGTFDLTPGAVSCGTHVGMDVWVDGVGTDTGVSVETVETGLPDGGVSVTNPPVQFMTCDQAFKTIDQAIAIGNTQGFWLKKDESFGFLSGIRVEFVDSYTLKAIGKPWADGYTVDYLGVKEAAIAYEDDQQANVDYNSNPPSAFNPANVWPSSVILVHEMSHMLQASGFLNLGDLFNGQTQSSGHCHWSTTFAPKYANLGWAQRSSNFVDTCNKDAQGEVMACSGAYCNYQKDTGGPSQVADAPVSK